MTTRTRAEVFAAAHTRITTNTNPRLDVARHDLDHTAPRFTQACKAMQDARPTPLGAANLDSNVTGGSGSNPTARLALAGDPGRADRIAFDRHLRILLLASTNPDLHTAVICRAAYGLRVLVDKHTPKPPTDNANTADECALTRDALGLWAEVYRTSDLGGLLPEPTPVGRWVYDQAHKLGRLPTPMEWKHHGSVDDQLRSQLIAGRR